MEDVALQTLSPWQRRRCRHSNNAIFVVVVALSLTTLAVSSQHDTSRPRLRADVKVNGEGRDDSAADTAAASDRWADDSPTDVGGDRTFSSPPSDVIRRRGKRATDDTPESVPESKVPDLERTSVSQYKATCQTVIGDVESR